MKKFVFAILASLIFVLSAQAATYYANSACSAGGDGTTSGCGDGSTRPFATLTAAVSGVPSNANHRIEVAAGDYNETLSDSSNGLTPGYRHWYADGTVTINRIIINGNYVKVDGFTISSETAPSWQGLVYVNSDYVVIDNLTMTNCSLGSADFFVVFFTGADNSTLSNSTFSGSSANNKAYVDLDGNNNTAENNTFHTLSGMDCFYGKGDGQIIKGNYAYNFSANGYHIDFVQNVDTFTNFVIEGNLVMFNTALAQADDSITFWMAGINVANGIVRNNIVFSPHGVNMNGPGNHDIEIYNNTFISDITWSTAYGTTAAISIDDGGGADIYNLTFKNNIVVSFADKHVIFVNGTNIVFDYNLFYNSDDSTPVMTGGSFPEANDVWKENPLFVNVGGTDAIDYKLQSGSPAKDAGVTLGSVTDDYDGNSRTAPFDIGAHEFGSDPEEVLPAMTGLQIGL